jgi:hypothetical protein
MNARALMEVRGHEASSTGQVRSRRRTAGPLGRHSPEASNPCWSASEGYHKRLECAALYNEPPPGFERAHRCHPAVGGAFKPSATPFLFPSTVYPLRKGSRPEASCGGKSPRPLWRCACTKGVTKPCTIPAQPQGDLGIVGDDRQCASTEASGAAEP